MFQTDMTGFGAAGLLASSAALFFLLRLYPLWPRRFQGCDAYNVLLCVETLRRTKRLPIRQPPVFLLEQQDQWYPPGFLVLCALLPEVWLKRYYWLINHVVDFLNVAIAFCLALGFDQPWIAAAIVIFYAMQFGLVHEYASLNTRPLGTLLLTGFLFAAYAGMEQPWAAALAAVLGVLLFYSHKLSLQQLWFSLPVLAVVAVDWRWLAWLPGLYLLSLAVWPRGFWRIVKGHAAIVAFWHRQWPLLGAHMVRHSPVYGDRRTRAGFYAVDGWRGFVDFSQNALQQNFFIIPVVAAMILSPQSTAFERFLLGWIVSVYLAATLIHVLPQLRGIGLGRQYIKFAIVPTAVLIAATASSASSWVWLLTAVAAALTAVLYLFTVRSLRRHSSEQTGQMSDPLTALLRRVQAQPGVRLMCLPTHLCDLVAYQTRVPVYWGTHSDCFDDRLAAFFPVMRRRLEEYARDDGLTHLLLDLRYVDAAELDLDPVDQVDASGSYALYRIGAASQSRTGLTTFETA